jgi:hypothetical protein
VTEALCGEAAKDLANGNWAQTTVLFIRGEELSPRQVWAKTLRHGALRKE